jgi:hypothetical protein
MIKAGIVCVFVVGLLLLSGVANESAARQRRGKARPGVVCPDPTVTCRTSLGFEPYQMPFRVPANAFIYESEKFYAVILKSVRDAADDCTVFIPEAERLAAQALFPRHKVFTSRCGEPGEVFYSDISGGQQFMGVYAGRTRAEAARMLARVRATGKFAGANLRRMYVGFNGT